MSISIQPVDGLINRLLQQNSKADAVKGRDASPGFTATADKVSISSQAQAKTVAAAAPQQEGQQGREKALESHLLKLYRMHDRDGG